MGEAYFDSWSPERAPSYLSAAAFLLLQGPMGNEKLEADRGEMGGERGSKGEGRRAGDNSADFTVFHQGLPCLPLLTSKLAERICARAQSALRPPVGERIGD